jgi:hypothetical protein
LTLAASAIATCQPASSSWSWTNRAPLDRLDRRVHRPAEAGDLAGKPTQSIHIGWCLDDLDGGAVLVQQAHVQTAP